jgi:hypothetical protein
MLGSMLPGNITSLNGWLSRSLVNLMETRAPVPKWEGKDFYIVRITSSKSAKSVLFSQDHEKLDDLRINALASRAVKGQSSRGEMANTR